MSRPRYRDPFPTYSPKKPAPARGIKVDKLGTTWWGKHWIEALERVLQGDAGRLARGRSYARAGRAHDLQVEAGRVSARVTGSRDPYEVRVELPRLSEETWRAAIGFMAQKAEFSAALLNGELPPQIDDAFVAASASLFPQQRADLKTSCDCPDWGDPCKHVAAVHYVLGEAFDRDPFLLFELRGRGREQVLAALRAARGQVDAAAPADAEKPPSVALEPLTPASYTAARAPLPTLSFCFEPPTSHAAVLRQLGAPSRWNDDVPAQDSLTPQVAAAAAVARQLALGEASAITPAPDPSPAPARPRRPRKR